ncbi:MAG: PAS domain S-box protein [Nitrospirae bacterium]|nr:PAS domain S-box protein [Nitrospirota bacterium]
MTANGEDRRITVYAVSIAVAWTIIIGGFFAAGVIHAKHETAERSRSDAWASIGKDVAFRQWIAKHGGVYVPITGETPSNPNLSHIPERDINTPSGKKLTLMNPAYALRQMMDDFSGLYGIRGHLTSLKPMREQNAPDEWEKKALLQFEKGVKEMSEISSINGKPYLRAMRPFITEKSCLKCHGSQGYKEGDVRGGISVSVPMEPYFKDERSEINLIVLTYGGTWVMVLAAISLVSQRIRRHVSSRRKAEAEVEYYTDRNRMILEAAGEGIIGLDSDGKQIFVNPSAAAMLGYTPEELINRKSHAIWHHTRPDGRHYLEEDCPMCRSYQKGEVVRETEVFWRKDGSSFPVEYTVTPIMQGNTIAGAVITFEDITGRRMADEALRRSEGSLKEAQRIAHIGNWELDLVSNVLTWSDEIYRIFEVDPEKFGASYEIFLDAIHPDDRDFVNKAYNDSLMNRTPYTIVHRLLMKDGRVKYVGERCETEYDPEGKPMRSIGTVQDITEQKKLEEQLRQAQKMEVVGQLAGGIAHDFNNILSAIIGYGSLTQMKMRPDDPLKSNVEQILEAADRAAQLTHSLLAFSRKQTLNMKPVDLNAVVRRVEKLLVRLIGEDIDFGTCLSTTALTVMADSGQVEQVLMNLATNARDAMPMGGILAIRTEKITIGSDFVKMHGCERPGEYALVSVTDTGIGMDAETQKKIFEPFFTTKELGRGTGLGLAMVYGIIQQHGGSLSVYSEPGRGTTFRIYLPLAAQAAAEEKQVGPGEQPVKGTETILLAEDDEPLRRLATSVLEEYGYTVIAAVDGEDAVGKFKENRDKIGLLIFDLVMPNKNGKDAYEEIRLISPDMKIIFSSGYTPDILRGKISLGDEVSIIFKPFSPLELLRKVRSVLDQKKA